MPRFVPRLCGRFTIAAMAAPISSSSSKGIPEGFGSPFFAGDFSRSFSATLASSVSGSVLAFPLPSHIQPWNVPPPRLMNFRLMIVRRPKINVTAMDDQREEKAIALPQELWNETAARAETAGCGMKDIIERALRAYFDLTGIPEPTE